MQAKHEKLALRLTGILIQLNSGNRLSAKALAEEYKVSLKTIKRDLDLRLIELPWKEQGPAFYQLNVKKMNNIGVDAIERFCRFAAVKELFPPIDHAFLDVLMNNHILVKGLKYENIDFHKDEFTQAEQTIASALKIRFDYKKINEQTSKQYCIEPYGLVNKNGIWYLIGVDAGKERTYSFKQVSNIEVLADTFAVNETLKEKLKQSDSLYHGNQIKQIVLKVGKTVAPYFQRQNLFPNQSIIRQLDNGDLLLECNDINEIEVLPIVKYWLPHITIISPAHLDQEIRDVLTGYLQVGLVGTQ